MGSLEEKRETEGKLIVRVAQNVEDFTSSLTGPAELAYTQLADQAGTGHIHIVITIGHFIRGRNLWLTLPL
jgi:hypothetical protein